MRFCWRLLAAILLALSAPSCGGGGGGGSTGEQHAEPVRSVLFAQTQAPVVINDPGSEDAFPRDALFLATFDAGPVTYNGSVVLDSWTAPQGSNQIKAANLSWMPRTGPRLWPTGAETTRICSAFNAATPQSHLQGNALANYIGADIWLQDSSTGKPTSGKTIIVSANFYFWTNGRLAHDTSPDTEARDYITALNAVQYIGAIGSSRHFETLPGSAGMRSHTWSAPEWFGICINREQAQALIDGAQTLFGGRMDIRDVTVKQAFIGAEVNTGSPSTQDRAGHGSSMTSRVTDWTVFTLKP